jgi:hypothetical protein
VNARSPVAGARASDRASIAAVTRSSWIVAASICCHAIAARAECPTKPDDATCRPWSALLMPTAIGVVYVPHDANGPYVGGGVELSYTWSDNSPASGPSQGKLRFDIAALAGTAMDASVMALYRGGIQTSFERNASRRWLIPYFEADIGGMWMRGIGGHPYVDGGLGLYLVHARRVIVGVDGAGVLPFSDVNKLGGVRASLALSFSLW